MRLVAVAVVVGFFLVVLNSKGFAAQDPPVPVSDCESITHPGNYVLANDLVLAATEQHFGQGGNCLVISASHVKIDMSGWTITVACPPFSYCPPEDGVVGGIGIDVLRGANHVSISNGTVEGFVYGVVGEANYITASNLKLTAVVGITLNNVRGSTFTDIAYEEADTNYHASNGPILLLSGGGENVFKNLSGQVGSDLSGPDGIDIVNSDSNRIIGVSMENTSCEGNDVVLSNGSSFNIVKNSTLFDECGGGIEVEKGSRHNTIVGDTVTIASPPDIFAMFDQNPDCGRDVWIDNTYSNELDAGETSASPANCIR